VVVEPPVSGDFLYSLNQRRRITTALETIPDVADFENTLLPTVVLLHAASRPLTALPPTKRLGKSVIKTWSDALTAFAPRLLNSVRASKADPNPTNTLHLINVFIERAELPGHVLINATNAKARRGLIHVTLPKGKTLQLRLGHELRGRPSEHAESPPSAHPGTA
jgi:hypothetical protein